MRRYLIAILFVVSSCSQNEFDPSHYAEKYCDCMKKNRKNMDFLQAQVVCDGMLLRTNRYFRAFYIEDYYGRYMMFQSKSFRDSVVLFRREFLDQLGKTCCENAVIGCDKSDTFQLKRKNIDCGWLE